MPFAIKKSTKVYKVGTRKVQRRGYKVFNSATGKEYSKMPLAKKMALKQLRALYKNVKS
jgi:hypothetical protein